MGALAQEERLTFFNAKARTRKIEVPPALFYENALC